MKLKKIPSLKSRRRYLFFHIHSEEGGIPYENARDAVMNSVLNWMGERGAAQANIRIIKNLWNGKEQKGCVQCSHKTVDEVKTALSLIYQIGDQKVAFQTVKVAGTIKSGKISRIAKSKK